MNRSYLILGTVCLAACGDPVVSETFVGTPELELGGVVRQANARIPSTHGNLVLSVFWIGANNDARPVEQDARLGSGLAEYSMTLFDPPPVSAGTFSELLDGAELAIGVIALYADKNDDGALDLTNDLLLGASEQHLLVYAGKEISASSPAAQLLGPISAGYHVYRHEQQSLCQFVSAASCSPEGTLVPATDVGAVSLVLWPEPEQVIVPAPLVLYQGTEMSVWAVP
jgi:hypothetical protein